jgi:hypothetical protein
MRRALVTLLLALLLPAVPAQAAQYADTAAREIASPAVAAPRAGVVEVFTRAASGALQRRTQDSSGRWSAPQALGGTLTSKPAAVSMSTGRTDVFARGGEGQLVHRYAVDGRWSPWAHLGGRLTGAPAAVSWSAGRLDVFARGTDGALHHRWYSAGRWFPWERLGGALASAPAAVSTAPGRLDVFARGTDGSLQQASHPGGWTWSSLGGTLHSEPAAVATGDGGIDVFVRGADGDLRQKSYSRASGWGPYSRLVGAVGSGPGATVTADGTTVLAARGPAGRYLVRTRPPGGSWSPWSAMDGLTPFRGLGAWIDLYDYSALDRTRALDDLRARGVRTLYLQTSRFSASYDMAAPVAGWLDAAHARGMQVVGWYLPGYGDMARDLRRTLAIAQLVTPGGRRFDAVGVDIEAHTGIGSSNEVSRTTMNSRAVEHLRSVRSRTTAPLAAITPQPTATDGAGETWEGFPWRAVGETTDLVLPMSYWPRTCRDACVRDYTLTNARYARSWTGLPVHIAGRGYPSADGTQVSDSDIRAFVDGAVAAGVLGGSVYDYASTRTRTAWWPALGRLNAL